METMCNKCNLPKKEIDGVLVCVRCRANAILQTLSHHYVKDSGITIIKK
jgi:hypothetical protein